MNDKISKKRLKLRPKSLFLVVLFLGLVIGFPVVDDTVTIITKFVVNDAEAVIGRPATPGSVAGARRRTRRRVTRSVAIGARATTLPAGFTTVVAGGQTYYVHDGVFYKRYYEGNNVVYVVVENPIK